MDIIGYARVSSREQSENSHALEQQIERLENAGAQKVFVDVESGWKGRDRPQLEEVLALVKSKNVSQVIVTRLDRLSRQGIKAFQIFETFLNAGVTLRALDEPFDLSTAAGRAMAGQLAVFAQLHSDQKAESIRAGWKHLRSRGTAINPPFGYRKVGDSLEIDDRPFLCLLDTQEERSRGQIARELIDLFLAHKSLGATLKELNLKYGILTFAHHREKGGRVAREMFRFSKGGLSMWLTNPVLRGHIRYLRRSENLILYDRHPAIMQELEFQQVQSILEFNRQHRGYSGKMKHSLSGLVVCGECRSACYVVTGSSNYYRAKRTGEPINRLVYYQCKNWRSRGCNNKVMVRDSVCESAAILALMERSETLANQVSLPLEQPEPIELLELRKQLDSLKLIRGNPAIERAIVDIESQIIAMQRNFTTGSELNTDKADLLRAFTNFDYWQSLSFEIKKQIYRDLIKEIVILNGEVSNIILNL